MSAAFDPTTWLARRVPGRGAVSRVSAMAVARSAAEVAQMGASAIERAIPGIAMLRSYRPRWLGNDLTAGLVLSALLVPQGMAYAELAGLPAITGLYTTILCLLAYAVFGPSKVLVLGPDS